MLTPTEKICPWWPKKLARPVHEDSRVEGAWVPGEAWESGNVEFDYVQAEYEGFGFDERTGEGTDDPLD